MVHTHRVLIPGAPKQKVFSVPARCPNHQHPARTKCIGTFSRADVDVVFLRDRAKCLDHFVESAPLGGFNPRFSFELPLNSPHTKV